ncbi:MAG: ATP-binding cassette domain-containing protein [Lautropia sp.]|nr:ATP-binding cassette domain-containing protein [Lautropia sp.]
MKSKRPERSKKRLSLPYAVRRLLAALARGQCGRLMLGVLLACVATLMGAFLLGVSGWFITATAMAGLTVGAALVFDVFMPSASIRLLALGRTGMRYAERIVTHAATLYALVDVRERLFRHFAQTGAARQRIWQLQPSRLLLRLTRDLNAAESLYLRLLVPGVTALLTSLGISVWLAFHDLWSGMACLLWFWSSGAVLTIWLIRVTIRPTLRHARTAERLRQQLLDLAGAQTELLMAGQFESWLHALQTQENLLATLDRRLHHIDAAAGAAWLLLQSLTLALALLVAARLVLYEDLDAAIAAFFVLMAMAGMEPFAALRRGTMEWAHSLLAARRLSEALAPEEADLPRATRVARAWPPARLAVQMRSVALTTPRGMVRVHDVDLDIALGERLALVGPSGSGKSSLLALISGELPPDAGLVLARHCIGMPQDSALFNDTLRANVDLHGNRDDDAVRAALTAAGLDGVVAGWSEGLDTVLGEAGTGLSKGQGRRLALARMFLNDSRFWLLDEPTDGLDADTAADVLDRLRTSARGRTLVIATHVRREAELADRIVLMDAGRIIDSAQKGTTVWKMLIDQLRDG